MKTLLCLLALHLLVFNNQDPAGVDLVKNFLAKDFDGKRVNSLGGYDSLFAQTIDWGELPEFDTYTVVKTYKYLIINKTDTTVQVKVTYEKLGDIEFRDPNRTFKKNLRLEEIIIEARLLNNIWKIVGSQIDPHVNCKVVLSQENLDSNSKSDLKKLINFN